LRHVGGESEAVSGGEIDELAHGVSPRSIALK